MSTNDQKSPMETYAPDPNDTVMTRAPFVPPEISRPAETPTSTEASVDLAAARALNVAVAALGVLLTAPVMLVLAILIKLTSRGPVFYTQTRIGLCTRRVNGRPTTDRRRVKDFGGRPFTIYKFRTMRVDAEAGVGAVWASQDDPRVTALGKILRQYRLDELPQLFNVLKGDMNVVGPRPERPAIFAKLREEIPDYHRRQHTLPGITGHAQINQEYDTSVESVRTKLAFDLEYLERRGFWEDLKIMLRTFPVVFLRRGGW